MSESSRWIFRQYHKDKIRCSERYHHKLDPLMISTIMSGDSEKTNDVIIIPDGDFLRKYIGLLEELLHHFSHSHAHAHGHHGNGTTAVSMSMTLILLESAAEAMDHRNNSPSIRRNSSSLSSSTSASASGGSSNSHYCMESASVNERNRILKLWQEFKAEESSISGGGVSIVPFPDLTYRYRNHDDDDYDDVDDFDLFNYEDMCINDRSRCAFVRAAKILSNHNQKRSVFPSGEVSGSKRKRIILLSQDEQMLQSGVSEQEDGFQVMDCNSFISFLFSVRDHSNIVNLELEEKEEENNRLIRTHWVSIQQRCEEEYNIRNKAVALSEDDNDNDVTLDGYGHFEYYDADKIQMGLRQKKLFKAVLKVTNENCKEAYCSISSKIGNKGGSGSSDMMKYYLNERHGHFNRALHEDVVIIEPLPEGRWEEPVGRRRLIQMTNEEDGGDDRDLTTMTGGRQVPTARVVGIDNSSRRRRKYVATVMNKTGPLQRDDSNILALPMDMKIPRIRIKRSGREISNKRLLVEIDGWDVNSSSPQGHLVKVLGDVGDLDTEIACLLIEHNIDLSPFSANALACLPSLGEDGRWHISSEEILKRRDLRSSCRIFSVDPAGCQDIDDAMHAKVLPNGDVEIGVHIADVTHFVQQNSALDKEATKRATTFYLVDRRFDMLPSLLSSDLCSLHGQIDRLAVSVIWTLSPDLKTVKSTWYGRTVIHNTNAMTYEQAHNILHDLDPDGPNPKPIPPLTAGGPVDVKSIGGLKQDLSILTKFTRMLRKRRDTIGGAVDLSSGDRGSEMKFVLDHDGKPTKVTPKKELEIHNTIAELMILANSFVAETIYNSFKDSALLRIHGVANADNFEELESLFKARGLEFDGKSNRALAKSLEDAKAKGDGSIKDSLFQSLATRAMLEAQYICTGAHEGGALSHYGLGIELYTHFTSPIRRYADVIVHRLLIASLLEEDIEVETKALKDAPKTSIPDSNAMSVLHQKGEDPEIDSDDEDNDEFLDSLLEGVEELAFGVPAEEEKNVEHQENKSSYNRNPYKTNEVAKTCERLNYQNRIAKLSSMQCQRLFLSLYFTNHVEVTEAVVVDLKQNGVVVYVPKFDMRSPLFLADKNGNVQVDPTIFHLSATSGLPPSTGFAHLETCRMFPDSRCILQDESGESDARVDLTVASTTISFSRLDVITVQLSCDLTDVTARVPPPRVHLISRGQKHTASSRITRSDSNIIKRKSSELKSARNHAELAAKTNAKSMFEVLSSFEINSDLNHLCPRAQNKSRKVHDRVQTIKGRMSFGGFTTKEDSPESLASSISENSPVGQQTLMGDYDANKRMEREATARIQRQAAQMRNAKRKAAKRK